MKRSTALLLMLVCCAPRVTLTAHVTEPGGDFCADFRLTEAQVVRFFARAQKVDAVQLHEAPWLPCLVRGTWGPKTFEIRAGGTAQLTAPSGEIEHFICEACAAEFGER